MKRQFALILVILIALIAMPAPAEEATPTEEMPLVPNYEELTVGNMTTMSGNFLSDGWGSDTSDMDVRALLHGYNLVKWNSSNGTFGIDDSVVSGIVVTVDGDGNHIYNVTLYDDMFYSDGTPITAKDYAFAMLFSVAPEVAELGANTSGLEYIVGIDEYRAGQAKTLSGLRILGDYQLRLTAKAEYFPYFYEMSVLSVTPLPIHAIAPGCEVADDGEGVCIRNALDENGEAAQEEPIFTAELLRETVLNEETGYMSHPTVTSGPYKLASYDDETNVATFEINEYYKGSNTGKMPRIPKLTFRFVSNEEAAEALANGEVGLINKCMKAETVDAIMEQVAEGTVAMQNYTRNGHSFISFCCEQPIVSDAAVRKAIANCLNKEEIVADYVGNYGVACEGYYGIGQWMYRMVTGSLEMPFTEPAAPEAGEAYEDEPYYDYDRLSEDEIRQLEEERMRAEEERYLSDEDRIAYEKAMAEYEENVALWNALTLDNLKVYEYDEGAAAQQLDDAGWTLNVNGEAFNPETDDVRCKEIDGELVPLELKLVYPESNVMGGVFETAFTENLAKVGIRLTVEAVPQLEIARMYYRQEERDVDMIYFASNFSEIFDPALTFNPDDAAQGTVNRTGLRDEKLYQLAVDMRKTEPGDVLGYCQKWIAFQEYWTEVLPEIPIYANMYFDFYTPALHEYTANEGVSWGNSIVGAYLSDAVDLPEAEDGETEEADNGIVIH